MARRTRAKLTQSLLDDTNSLNDDEFADKFLPSNRIFHGKDGRSQMWTFHSSTSLSEQQMQRCLRLIETTSSADYEKASQGWRPDYKFEEMREEDMRYILMEQDNGVLLGFASFMITSEDDEPVIYIYEIHLSADLRGSGIGKALMRLIEDIGGTIGTKMSMLTVFTANTHAETFYRKLGYIEDESSPRERRLRGGKVKRPEYLIMSKMLDG